MSKPEKLIPHLRKLRYDPAAKRIYEMMSGGFMWTDELPQRDRYSDALDGDCALWFLFGYRAWQNAGLSFQAVWPNNSP